MQPQADHEHMEVLKLAIEGLFLAQQQQSIDLGVDSKRIETTVESVTKLKSACKAHAEQTDERFQWIHENVKPTIATIINEVTPGLVDARVAGIEAALAKNTELVEGISAMRPKRVSRSWMV